MMNTDDFEHVFELNSEILEDLSRVDGTLWKESYGELHSQYNESVFWILLYEDSDVKAVHKRVYDIVFPRAEKFFPIEVCIIYEVFRNGKLFTVDMFRNNHEALEALKYGDLGERCSPPHEIKSSMFESTDSSRQNHPCYNPRKRDAKRRFDKKKNEEDHDPVLELNNEILEDLSRLDGTLWKESCGELQPPNNASVYRILLYENSDIKEVHKTVCDIVFPRVENLLPMEAYIIYLVYQAGDLVCVFYTRNNFEALDTLKHAIPRVRSFSYATEENLLYKSTDSSR